MYKNILVATDLLESGEILIKKALGLAKAHHAELDVLHVIEPPVSAEYAAALGFATFPDPSTEEATLVLETFGEAHGISKEHQHIAVGKVSTRIIEHATKLNADLILLGSHAEPGLGLLLGSTTHSVIHHAKVDVLIVRIGN